MEDHSLGRPPRANTHLHFVSLCLSLCQGGCRFLCWRNFCGNVSTAHEDLCALFLLFTRHPLGCALWTCAAVTLLDGAAHTGFLHSVAPFFPHGLSNVSKCRSLGNSFLFICCSDQAALNIPARIPPCTCIADSLGECSRREIAGMW